MEELAINILVEAKTEYTRQLTNTLTPYLYEGIDSIYDDSRELANNNVEVSTLKMFQNLLKKVPKWNQDIIDKETQRILDRSQCVWLSDLIAAVFVSNTKILTAVRVVNSKKKINLKIPKIGHFVHRCYVECAREFYKNPFLMDKENVLNVERQRSIREAMKIIEGCVCDAVRKLLPFQEILQQYLGESFADESDDDITENKYLKTPVKKSKVNEYLTDSEDEEKGNIVDILNSLKEDNENFPDIDIDKEDDENFLQQTKFDNTENTTKVDSTNKFDDTNDTDNKSLTKIEDEEEEVEKKEIVLSVGKNETKGLVSNVQIDSGMKKSIDKNIGTVVKKILDEPENNRHENDRYEEESHEEEYHEEELDGGHKYEEELDEGHKHEEELDGGHKHKHEEESHEEEVHEEESHEEHLSPHQRLHEGISKESKEFHKPEEFYSVDPSIENDRHDEYRPLRSISNPELHEGSSKSMFSEEQIVEFQKPEEEFHVEDNVKEVVVEDDLMPIIKNRKKILIRRKVKKPKEERRRRMLFADAEDDEI